MSSAKFAILSHPQCIKLSSAGPEYSSDPSFVITVFACVLLADSVGLASPVLTTNNVVRYEYLDIFFLLNQTKYVPVAPSFQNDELGLAQSRGNLSIDSSYSIIWCLMASLFHWNFMSV